MHKYLPLLHIHETRKVLAVDELKMYDLYTPMVKDVRNAYEEAKEWMLKALEPMGESTLM